MMARRRKPRRRSGLGKRVAEFLATRPPVWILRALVVGVPLLVVPRMEDAFRSPKLLAAQILALLSIAFLALREGRRDRPSGSSSHPLLVALLLLVPAAASGWSTEHPEHYRAALLSLSIALVAFVAWSRWLRPEEIRGLLDWQLVPAVVLSAGVALQRLGLQLFRFEAETGDRLTLTAWAGGPFDLSAWLLIPALWLQVRLLEQRGHRLLSGLGLLLVIGAMATTQTVSTLAVLGLASVWLWSGEIRRLRGRAAVFCLLAMVVAVGLSWNRLVVKVGDLGSGSWNSVLTGRLDGWRAALSMAGDAPVLGVGHGAFRAEFGTVKAELVREGESFFRRHESPYFVNAHSEPLEVLAESGGVGLLCLVLAVALVVRRWIAGPLPDPLARIFRSATLALGFLSLANFPWRLALVAYPALLVLAGAFVEPEPEEEPVSTDDRRRAWGPPVVAALFAALAFGAGQSAWKKFEAQEILRGARALVEAGASSPAPFCRRAEDLLEEARRDLPWDVRFDSTRGDLFMILGSPRAAERAYREALALEPRPEIRANLGLALRELGREEEALAAVREAILVDRTLRRRLVEVVPELRSSKKAATRDVGAERPESDASDPLFGDAFESGGVDSWTSEDDGR